MRGNWREIGIAGLVAGLLTTLAAPASASPSYGGNCVFYARSVSGVALDGNAGAWWSNAAGRYSRGSEPAAGAVLVFKPGSHMRVGHVAVVSRVVSRREILVDQANWVRGRVVKNMSVIDASPNNDWTSVRVIELHSGTHGRENPTYGFIYPDRIAPDRAVPEQARPHSDDKVVTAATDRAVPVRLAAARIETPKPAGDRPARETSENPSADKPQKLAVRVEREDGQPSRSRPATAVATAAPPPPPHKPNPKAAKAAE